MAKFDPSQVVIDPPAQPFDPSRVADSPSQPPAFDPARVVFAGAFDPSKVSVIAPPKTAPHKPTSIPTPDMGGYDPKTGVPGTSGIVANTLRGAFVHDPSAAYDVAGGNMDRVVGTAWQSAITEPDKWTALADQMNNPAASMPGYVPPAPPSTILRPGDPNEVVAARQFRDEGARRQEEASRQIASPVTRFAANEVVPMGTAIGGTLIGGPMLGGIAGGGVATADTVDTIDRRLRDQNPATNPDETFRTAEAVGAITAIPNATVNAFAGVPGGIAKKIGADALVGAGSNLITQTADRVVTGQPISAGQVLESAAGGAAIGGVMHGAHAAIHGLVNGGGGGGEAPSSPPEMPAKTPADTAGGEIPASTRFDPALVQLLGQPHEPPVPVQNLQSLDQAFKDVQQRQQSRAQTLAEGPGEVPQAVRTYDEIRRMSASRLQAEAAHWGVTFDSPSTTIPRILDAQEEWRIGQMSDKQLWDEVRARGLRAGDRTKNIQTILGTTRHLPEPITNPPERPTPPSNGNEPPSPDATGGGVPRLPQNPSGTPTGRTEGQPGGEATVNAPPAPPSTPTGATPSPSSPVPRTAKVQGQTAATDTATATDPNKVTPSRTPVKGKPKPFSVDDLRGRIQSHYDQYHADTAAELAVADEHAQEEIGAGATTFRRDPRTSSGFPRELENQFAPEELRELRRRRLITLAEPGKTVPTASSGEDAMSESGMGIDRYTAMLRRGLTGNKDTRFAKALDFARSSGEPNAELWAAIHDAKKNGRPKEIINPSEKPAGTTFKLHGHDFEITEDEDGNRLLKDGEEFPVVPADHITEMPADKGSVRHEDPEVPEGDVFGAVVGEEGAEKGGEFFDADAAGVSGAKPGIFGQPTFDNATGSETPNMFHEPARVSTPVTERVGGSRNASDPANTAEMFPSKSGEVHGAAGPERVYKKKAGDGGQSREVSEPAGKPEQPSLGRAPSPASNDTIEPNPDPVKGNPKDGDVLGHGASPANGGGKASDVAGVRKFVDDDVVPAARGAVEAINTARKKLQSTFAPQTLGDAARTGADVLRARLGDQNRNVAVADAALSKAKAFFDARSVADNNDFTDRFQAGEKQADPHLDAIATVWKQLNRDQVKRLQELGDDVLNQYEENHIKQVWKETATEPGKVQSVLQKIMARRPLEGSKGFLKKKTFATYKDGREYGLHPLYDNPVEAMMHGYTEAEKFIQMRRFANEYKHNGVGKYVEVGTKVPDDYAIVDDPAFHVYGAPKIEVNEFVNKSVWDALNAVGKNMGLDIQTKMTTPEARGAMGYMRWGTPETVRRFGTDLGVLSHEISHQLDARFNLKKTFMRKEYAEEIRALADLHEYKKDYFRTADEKMASILEAYMTAPETMRTVAPSVYKDFEAWMSDRPETHPILDLERSLALQKLSSEVSVPGIRQLGSYALPKEVAAVVKNHLSPGLRGDPIYRGAMGVSNLLNQIQLSGFFHAGFTSGDAAISRGALGIEQLANGKPLAAARSIVTAPAAPFTNAYYGHRLIGEYMKPGSDPELSPIVRALVEGGARVRPDPVFQTKVRANMVKAFRKGNLLGGIVRIPGAALETVSLPLMEKLVPMQKWGVLGDLMKEELNRLGPTAEPDAIRTAARKVVDSVDNRMGQVNYDNLFIDRSKKDALMAIMRSVGWNLGTFRELGGAAVDAPKDLVSVVKGNGFSGRRVPYALSLLGMTAFAGGLYQYLKTGEYPSELKDFYFPKTGRKDENGEDIRVQMPTYMRDLAHLTHGGIGQMPSNLADMAQNKVSPLLSSGVDMIRNHDYYGRRVTDPTADGLQKTFDRIKYLGKQAVPFTVQSWQNQGENAPLDEKAGAMVGLTPAPRRYTRTPAEELASQILDGKGDRVLTAEQADKSKVKSDLVKGIKLDPKQGGQKLQDAVAAGTLTSRDAKAVETNAALTPLQRSVRRLEAADAVRVLHAASEKERPLIEQQVRDKVLRSDKPPEQQDAMLKEAGIEPPPELPLTREYHALNQRAEAYSTAKREYPELLRKSAATANAGDQEKAATIREQAVNAIRENHVAPADTARRERLGKVEKNIREIRQRVEDGLLDQKQGEDLIRRWVRAAG